MDREREREKETKRQRDKEIKRQREKECVWERERKGKRETERERKRERDNDSVGNTQLWRQRKGLREIMTRKGYLVYNYTKVNNLYVEILHI